QATAQIPCGMTTRVPTKARRPGFPRISSGLSCIGTFRRHLIGHEVAKACADSSFARACGDAADRYPEHVSVSGFGCDPARRAEDAGCPCGAETPGAGAWHPDLVHQ